MTRLLSWCAVAAFVGTIPAANWAIGNIGMTCVPHGPCLLPVWPGLMAPSGVVLVGIALVLRDAVQRHLGASWAVGAVVVGAGLSALVATPILALASAVAFLLSEAADMAVYTPLARRRLVVAVLLSGVAGAVIDSAVFLWLAFGSLDLLAGQVVGKAWATVGAAAFLSVRRA